MRIVYLNGQFVPESEAKLSIYDLSVMQSAAAFEMTRSFHGVPFKLHEHLDRLWHSTQLLGIPIPRNACWSGDALEHLCHEVARQNDHGPGEEHRLLIVVSPGCAPMYKDLEGVIPHPFVYIADFPLRYTVAGFSTYFTEGVHCVTSKIQQVPDACVPSAAKHRSRLHFHLAQQQAPAGTWPLLLGAPYTEDGIPYQEYTEAPGANLVYVRSGGDICTVEENCLPGISLAVIKELLGARAGEFSGYDRRHASELWLTGTPFFAVPVVSVDGKPIGDGQIGPVYTAMMEKADALVGLCIKDQICRWDRETRHA